MKFLFVLSIACAIVLAAGCNQRQSAPAREAAPAAVIDPATTGSVSGMVRFEGEAPKPVTIDMSQDPGCAIGNPGPNLSQAVVVNAGKLGNVYVYVKDSANGITKASFPVPSNPGVLDQKGCRYTPHVLGIMTGQKLRVLNSDSTLHNVHPSPAQNAGWNVSQMPKGDPLEKVFEHPESMVEVKCNQHPWMKMYLHIAPHPFFAVTGADGQFAISGLPPGEYTIAALHERLGEQTQKISIGPKENRKTEFTFRSQP
jgi:plastocyanin